MPTRHEGGSVEWVPVEEGRYATPGKIDKEEVVTEKRPMVKEEIRVRMDVVEEEGVIEEDVRKEEIDGRGLHHAWR